MDKATKIEISLSSLISAILLLIGLWLLYQVKDIVLLLFVAIIFASSLSPLVDKIESFRIPRSVAIMILYLLSFGVVIALVVSVVPVIVNQVTLFLKYFPSLINKFPILRDLSAEFNINNYSSELTKLPVNIIKLIVSIFSNVIKIFVFIVVTFYLLIERRNLNKVLLIFFSQTEEKKIERIIKKFEHKLGGWVRGQLTLMFVVGLMSWLGLRLLDVEFALPLAVIAGLLELVPNIGPTISMIPAVLVALSVSFPIGLAVIALYFLIQQLENNLIVPKIMQKAVGIHPLLTIFALMVGFKLGRIGGSILAIPILLTVQIVLEEVFGLKFTSLNKKT